MMDFRVLGASAEAQRSWLLSQVAASRGAGRPVVLFVPEQYTLQAERDLMTGLKLPGLLDLDVVSPTRLKSLVRERAGFNGRAALDEAGRAMVLHRALQRCGGELSYYQRLDSLYGAVARMDRTLCELQEENLAPEDLDALAEASRGAQRVKYQDLGKIWRTCLDLQGDRFDDPAAAWRDTCARLPASGLWRGADLYVYGFDTVRPDLRQLLLAAAGVCRSVRVLLTMREASAPAGRIYRPQRDSAAALLAALEERGIAASLEFLKDPPPAPEDVLGFLRAHVFSETGARFPGSPGPALSLFAAPHPTGEALDAVAALHAWHREGIPWNRMAVALPRGVSGESLRAALTRHHIPFFFSRREELVRHGVSQLLSAALTCVSRGPDTESLLRIARSGFSTLTREEGDRLQAYVRAWGIDRRRWQKPFSRGEDAAEAEELRLRLLEPLDHLHSALLSARSAEASVEAVFLFLREEDVYTKLQARQERLLEEGRFAEAVVDRQVWDLLMNLLDQLYALLGGRRATLKEIAALLQGALERASLSALPEEEEGVAVGQIGHMLPGRLEAMIVPGMNEGVMNARDDSLLSDPERGALEARAGRAVGMNQARLGMMVRSDYIRTLSLPERYLRVSYCLRSESGSALLPGEPVAELRRLFPALREEGGLTSAELPPVPGLPSLALETAVPLLREIRSGARAGLSPEWEEALRSLAHHPDTASAARSVFARMTEGRESSRISGPVAVRLFHGERVSVSRLECFASCPRLHFLRYGLRPLLPRTFEFTPGDAGNFYHLALQQYMDQAVRDPAWPRLREDRVAALMDTILDQLTLPWEEGPLREDALGGWQGEEILRRARHAASVLTRFAANGDFQVLGTELEFGEGTHLPPLVLRLEDGAEIALRGKIDRLDRYRGPDGDYLRILDLKSSEKSLDPARMDSGEQLQLMIYLRAALLGHPGAAPAGALYFPVLDREVSAESPEEAEEQRIRAVQLKGVVLGEENILRAMDRDRSPFSLPKIFNRDGSISKSASWALPEEVLRSLMEAAVRKAAEICGQIRAGQVSASPSVSADRTPCSFCEFQSVCPARKKRERALPRGLDYADVGRDAGADPAGN